MRVFAFVHLYFCATGLWAQTPAPIVVDAPKRVDFSSAQPVFVAPAELAALARFETDPDLAQQRLVNELGNRPLHLHAVASLRLFGRDGAVPGLVIRSRAKSRPAEPGLRRRTVSST